MNSLAQNVLWYRARRYLKTYEPTLVGVTGSYGKTLATAAIELAIRDAQHVRASDDESATPIDAALTILGTRKTRGNINWVRALAGSKIRELKEKEPDTIITEVTARHPGNVDLVARKLPFSVGVVTHSGATHLDLYGSKEMVTHEQMSLTTSLPDTGYAILNADDDLIRQMSEHTNASVIWFGEASDAHVRLLRAERRRYRGFVGEVSVRGQRHEFSLPYILSRHQLSAMLAALAVAHVMSVSIAQAIDNLQGLKPPAGRGRLFNGINDSVIFDDAYNAVPEAVLAALQTLYDLPGEKKIAILGEMENLGAKSQYLHKQVGAFTPQIADMLVAIGPKMKEAQGAALEQGGIDVHHFETVHEAAKWLPSYIKQNDTILVKGGTHMNMDEITARIVAK